jgi:hypothetical protein
MAANIVTLKLFYFSKVYGNDVAGGGGKTFAALVGGDKALSS